MTTETAKTKLTRDQLLASIKERREALCQTRFAGAGSKAADVKAGRGLRREIAQALTALQSIK